MKFFSVFAPNLQIYYLHHVFKNLQDCNPRSTFSVILLNEKFSSLTIKVWIRLYTNEWRYGNHVYEDIRFVDSCKFLISSLDELVRILSLDKFTYLDNHYASQLEDDLAFIGQKELLPTRMRTVMQGTWKMVYRPGTSGQILLKKLL